MGVQLREAAEERVRLDEEIRVTTERLAAIVGEREATRAALADTQRLVAEHPPAAQELEVLVEQQRARLTDERDRLEGVRLGQNRIAAERTDATPPAGRLRERGNPLARRPRRLARRPAA